MTLLLQPCTASSSFGDPPAQHGPGAVPRTLLLAPLRKTRLGEIAPFPPSLSAAPPLFTPSFSSFLHPSLSSPSPLLSPQNGQLPLPLRGRRARPPRQQLLCRHPHDQYVPHSSHLHYLEAGRSREGNADPRERATDTPTSLVTCEPSALEWSGGTEPYYVSSACHF